MITFYKNTRKNKSQRTEKLKIHLLEHYQASSRRDRDLLWARHNEFRDLFDGVETAEVFIAEQSSDGFSIHRFGNKYPGFVEYQTLF